MIKVNTENILFIGGGAFDGVERKIAKRLNTRMVGFTSDIRGKNVESGYELLKYITPADLRSFGLIPELIGRMPVLTYLMPLSDQALRAILTEPQNAISKQYKKLLDMDGIELRIDEAVYDFIVSKAREYNVGARGLRSIFEDIMRDLMYDAPSAETDEEGRKIVRITKSYAEKHLRQTTLDQMQRQVG